MRGSIMALQPGTRLDAYEVLSPIGAGGMGEVYRALTVRGRSADFRRRLVEVHGDASA